MEEEKKVEETEIVEEVPAEEVELEIQDQEESKKENNKYFEFDKNDTDYVKRVEEKRLDILNQNKKTQRRSTIVSALMLVFMIAGLVLFLINKENKVFVILGIVFLALGVLVLIVGSILNRRILKPDVKNDYIIPATKEIVNHIVNDPRYSDCSMDYNDRIDVGVLFTDGVYDGITDMVSRAVFKGKFKEHSFSVGEVGIYTGPKGRGRKTAFIGKYISTLNELHFVDHYVIVSKGEAGTDAPNVPAGLMTLFNDDNFIIYGPEGADYEKDLGKEFISSLRGIKIEHHCYNLSIGIWAGHTSTYLSFDDEVMSLPYYKPLNEEAIDSYKELLARILEILVSIA